MIQRELDYLETAVLTDIFGGCDPKDFVIQKGFFKIDLSDRVQKYINEFEEMAKPFMSQDGTVNGAELNKVISIPYINIPDYQFRLVDLYREVSPLVKKIIGAIL